LCNKNSCADVQISITITVRGFLYLHRTPLIRAFVVHVSSLNNENLRSHTVVVDFVEFSDKQLLLAGSRQIL